MRVVDGDAVAQALEQADAASARLDPEAVVTHLSTAVRLLTGSGDNRSAAMACIRLGDALAHSMGNLTAARAWYARAARLVADEPPCLEQGWVAVAAMGCDVEDPAALLAAAELALDRARRFGDVNLETKALADAGLARVQSGRLDDGMALLEEAMALACGPADNTDTTAKSVCSFFTACYHSADFGRASSWADLLRRRGLIGPGAGAAAFLSSHCDSVQATLLVELGRWGEAESLLERAKADFETATQLPSWHPDIALGDLRIRQGRLADAEALLLGKDQAIQALLPAARLHLARGDHELARASARRGLRSMGADRLRAAELLAVVVDSELAVGDIAAAQQALSELAERVGKLDLPALQGRTALSRARVLNAAGSHGEAVAVLEAAVDNVDIHKLPWLRSVLLIELAGLRDRSGDGSGARIDAEAAAAILATLDVVVGPAPQTLLDRLTASQPRSPTATISPAGKWCTVTCDGLSVRLRHTKGLRYLAELLTYPGVERHVLDLVDRVEGVDPAGQIDRRLLGNAGALLDTQARATYRRRIEELRAEIDDALESDQLETAEALHGELDQLVEQLAQAFGLGGRNRPTASAAERARLNVTRALRSAIERITEAMPAQGPALDRRIRTGLYCIYSPADDEGVRWIVQPQLNENVGK